MSRQNKQTIVQSTAALRHYPRKHIDAPTIDLLNRCIPCASRKSNLRAPLIGLLDCYLGVTGQSISYISLSKSTSNKLFRGFIGALMSEAFVRASDITRDSYVRGFSKALEAMSAQVPNLSSTFDIEVSLSHWEGMQVAPLQREYYQGWHLTNKTGMLGTGLKLAWMWAALGPNPVRAIHEAAREFASRYEGKSQGNFAPVINDLMAYIQNHHSKISNIHLADPSFTTKLIEGFCRAFFEQKTKAGNCLETTIKRWNDAIPFLEASLINSGVFAKPYRKFPYIEPSRKIGAESKLAMREDGTLVKDKLIVDVPLSLTDDEVIELLFEKINKEVENVLTWANQQASSIVARFEQNGSAFNYRDFDLTAAEIRAKYRTTTRRKARSTTIANNFGLPTSYALEPFVYLLIKEHPQITESFLFGLELFDKHNKLVGIEVTDTCTYLVGYKRRRGGRKAQQKIALSNKAALLVDQVIKLTDPLRKYLRSKEDFNYRYLLLSCRTGFCHPLPIRTSLEEGAKAAFDARQNQFLAIGGNEKTAKDLVTRLSPTRFRATVGLQVFLATGSAKAMSEALGHAKYKPDLLAHYLPEPILAFFQSRWIRIFQKGIVCEAMKDSPLLLRASHFKSMDELSRFLNNHALNLPCDSNDTADKNMKNAAEVCISVDENILAALLSLESAVASADQSLVSAKARYWAKFSSLLRVEIEQNTFDPEVCQALDNARCKVNPILMQGLIYESNIHQKQWEQ